MKVISDAGRVRPAFTPSHHFLILSLAWFSALTGCTADPGSDDGGSVAPILVSVTDSSGVEVVTNSGDGWDAESAWRIEPDLQVGELDGPLAFGRISWVAPAPGDGMLVLDAQSRLVHVFDSSGRPVRSFGGEGDGPGEFRRPAAVMSVYGGRIAVSQGFPPVLHWLTLDGEHEGTTRLPGARDEAGTRTAGSFGLWQVTPAGRVFVQAQVIDPGAEDGEMPVVLLEVDRNGASAPDTIAEWTWKAGFGDEPIRMFEPVHTWMPRSDGIVILSPGLPYELQWYDAAAGLRRIVRRDLDSAPVTNRHRELAVAEMREGMESGGAPDDMIEDMLDRVEFEAVLPPVLRVWVSEPDGRVWVGVHDADRLDPEGGRPFSSWVNAWDVFERDGPYLGRVPAPDGFTLRVVTADALYGVWEDELEVPFARRYRVVRPDTRISGD